ncbi:MAG: LPS export ABC transporter periplasmic protein LptC [Mariprofundales bacterium]|nr:LPS export ABC transporter periplasmic protein LptC [Mariprofundales bacterium]
MLHSLKYIALMVAVGSVAALSWLAFSTKPGALPQSTQLSEVRGETMQAQLFQYTEIINGNPIYRLSGREIHDENAKVGPLRISAVKIHWIEQPRVELLMAGMGKGWILTANKGRIVAGRKRLTLSGNVHGRDHSNGTLLANTAVVDVSQGGIQLRNGYTLNTLQRREKGIETTL